MNKIYVVIFALLLIIGCKHTNKEKSNIEIIKLSQPSASSVGLSELIDKQHYIKLETTPENLVGVIGKVSFSDSLIFLGSNKAIFLFHSNGQFIRKIDMRGDGPSEYTRLSDFDIDYEEKEIIVFDKGKKQLLFYDFQGNYIRKISLDIWAIKLKKISEGQHMLFSGNELSDKKNSSKFTIVTEKGVAQRFHEIDKNKSKYLHVMNNQFFYENNSELFFYELFNDTVYLFDRKSGFIPKYYFSFDNKNIPYSFFERPYANIMEFFQEYRKTDYAYGISTFMETNQKILLVYYVGGKPCYMIYDKTSKNANTFRLLEDNISFAGIELPNIDDDFRFWTYKGKLIYFLQPSWILDRHDHIQSDQLRRISGEISFDDNPVMVIATMK